MGRRAQQARAAVCRGGSESLKPMKARSKSRCRAVGLPATMLVVILTAAGFAAPSGSARAAIAPIGPYLTASKTQDIALARSAAPPSISAHASVMVLGNHGYVTAVKGSNGFVCLVVRLWGANSISSGDWRFE